MASIMDILKDMPPELFEDSDDDLGVQIVTDDNNAERKEETPPVYQEEISNSIAQGLLSEEDYDENCHYQLIHSMDSTVVLKIDDRITPEEEAAALEKDPDTTHLHLREIELCTDESEVETYAEMHQNYVGMNKDTKGTTLFARPELLDYDLKKHHNWGIIACISVLAVLLICGIFLFLLTYQYLM